jgi:hypothetical protein
MWCYHRESQRCCPFRAASKPNITHQQIANFRTTQPYIVLIIISSSATTPTPSRLYHHRYLALDIMAWCAGLALQFVATACCEPRKSTADTRWGVGGNWTNARVCSSMMVRTAKLKSMSKLTCKKRRLKKHRIWLSISAQRKWDPLESTGVSLLWNLESGICSGDYNNREPLEESTSTEQQHRATAEQHDNSSNSRPLNIRHSVLDWDPCNSF